MVEIDEKSPELYGDLCGCAIRFGVDEGLELVM